MNFFGGQHLEHSGRIHGVSFSASVDGVPSSGYGDGSQMLLQFKGCTEPDEVEASWA